MKFEECKGTNSIVKASCRPLFQRIFETMRLFYGIVVSCLLLGTMAAAQPVALKIRPMEGYFILGKNKLNRGVNCMVISERKDFVKLFGLMNQPDTPDFEKEIVLVLALSPTRKQARIYFERTLYRANDAIEAYCGVEQNLYPLTYEAYPIVLGAIPRQQGVTHVRFYNRKGMKLMATVPTDR